MKKQLFTKLMDLGMFVTKDEMESIQKLIDSIKASPKELSTSENTLIWVAEKILEEGIKPKQVISEGTYLEKKVFLYNHAEYYHEKGDVTGILLSCIRISRLNKTYLEQELRKPSPKKVITKYNSLEDMIF
ncbi:hypothetical protein V7166_22980 [Bacillus thuringiensis]